jgi:hypothetical protein
MPIGISASLNVNGFLTTVTLTGLTPGTRYDVMRLQLRFTGDDDTGNPTYHRELPDRRKLWSSVAHRVGWPAPVAVVKFRDYEPLRRPFSYFVVPSAAVGPADYDWANEGRYPLSRGVLDDQVVHFNRAAFGGAAKPRPGEIMMRSTWELGLWTDACVYDFDVGYQARGSELTVMKREDPMFIADTRESRRGTLTLMTDRLGQYHDLRRMLFPANGRIRPVTLNSGGDSTMMLDDMDIIPLDVTVEQATQSDPDLRFIHIDFIETDATGVKLKRSGDNDNFTVEPVANFTLSDGSPSISQWLTLTDTSTGALDEWDWTLSHKSMDNRIAKFSGQGPHKVRFGSYGKKIIKLRVNGPEGADVQFKEFTVGT